MSLEEKYCLFSNPCKKGICCNLCKIKTCKDKCHDDINKCKYKTDVNKWEVPKERKDEEKVKNTSKS